VAATAAGAIRTALGDYLVAFLAAASLCLIAALITQVVRSPRPVAPGTPAAAITAAG
jgi:hypothetical protein